MTTETLEQKTNEKQEIKNSETITARCGYCNKELQIPKKIMEEIEKARYKFEDEKSRNPFLNKQYDGFYISTCGPPFCDKDHCFWMFTED